MLETTTRREFLMLAGGSALSALAMNGCTPVEQIGGKVTAVREERCAPAVGDPALPISVYVLRLSRSAEQEYRVFASEFKGEGSAALVGREVVLEKSLGFWRLQRGGQPHE